MEVVEESDKVAADTHHKKSCSLEIEIYLHLLVLMHLLDSKRFDKVSIPLNEISSRIQLIL